MHPEFWHAKWANNQIGFHEKDGNALMAAYFDTLELAPGARVFVPLCGKTRDIGRLMDKGFRVLGVELSELAVRELFRDLAIGPDVVPVGEHMLYRADGIDIFVGDYFALTAKALGPVDAVYDRAAMVALPPVMRGGYPAHLMALTETAPQLLLTYEYDQSKLDGPPFSVSPAEVEEQYGPFYALTRLEDVPGEFRGAVAATETVWRLQPR